jgi:hypothetical protein
MASTSRQVGDKQRHVGAGKTRGNPSMQMEQLLCLAAHLGQGRGSEAAGHALHV